MRVEKYFEFVIRSKTLSDYVDNKLSSLWPQQARAGISLSDNCNVLLSSILRDQAFHAAFTIPGYTH